jgi:hypothetical protein
VFVQAEAQHSCNAFKDLQCGNPHRPPAMAMATTMPGKYPPIAPAFVPRRKRLALMPPGKSKFILLLLLPGFYATSASTAVGQFKA